VRELVRDPGRFRGNVARLRADWVYNVGRSGIAGAEAIAMLAREMRDARLGRDRQVAVR